LPSTSETQKGITDQNNIGVFLQPTVSARAIYRLSLWMIHI
jgi:hypothetical protein